MKRARASRPSTKSANQIGRSEGRLGCRGQRRCWRCALALVFGAAKAKDREEDEWEQKQSDPEACAFPEIPSDVNAQDDPDDKIDEGNEQQDQPPARPAGHLAHHVGIKDRNDRCPARLSSFAEHLPHCRDHQNDERDLANPENRAGTFWGFDFCFLSQE